VPTWRRIAAIARFRLRGAPTAQLDRRFTLVILSHRAGTSRSDPPRRIADLGPAAWENSSVPAAYGERRTTE
jgi:hypothetical protein